MTVLHFWIYTNKEIRELEPAFAKRFIVRDFYLDAENKWEYMEGKSKALNARIDITREYGWKDYLPEEKPIHIAFIFKKRKKRQNRIDKLGRKLHRHFKTTVHYGKLRHAEGSSYDFISNRTFPDSGVS